MCVVSMIGDHYRDKFSDPNRYHWLQQHIYAPNPPAPSRAEFDALKKEVEELKALLKRAKEYDERNGEPDCEMDDKVAILRKVAELVGVDLNDVLGKG